MAKEKKPYIYKGYEFTDNGHGDYYNAEVDKFLIFRPGPMMVDTVMHKDGSVTMNQNKFKENTDKNKGVYESGYEINEDGSIFVEAGDVDEEIEEESKDNKSTSEPGEESKDDNLEDSGLDNYDKEKLEGLIGYGIPQDVSDDFTDITGEESQAIEDAISEIDDSLTGYEELNDFEEEYGAIRDYDRLDNLEYDLSEYIGNHELGDDFKNEVENIIGSAEDTANETLDFDIQNYLDSHKFAVEEDSYEEGVERRERATQMYLDGDIDYDDLVDSYFDGNREGADEYIKDLKEEESQETGVSEKLPENREYRFDFGFKDGSSLRDDAFDDAKAYLEEEDMAQYLDEPLKSKVDSMKWVLDDVDKVHVEVKTNSPLTDEEMKELKSEIEGQNSDGLGEGFEQQDFAEAYYDPDTGDGPYTYQEVLDIVQENYDNMEFDDYKDYIEYDDLREGLENYLRDGNYDVSFEDYLVDHYDYEENGYESEEAFREHLEQTPEEELFDEFSEEYEGWLDDEESSFEGSGYEEEYINQSAIDNAKDEVARNDYRFNENLWGDGMTSMEWDIPDGVDVTPKSETVIEDDMVNISRNEDDLLDKVDRYYTPQIDGDTVSTIASAFNDTNDSHAFGVDKAVDKLLEYGEVVKVNPGNNGSNRVEVEVNNGQGKIIFNEDGASLTGTLDAKQLSVYDEAIKEYEKHRNDDVSFNFDTNKFEANLPKNAERLAPIDPYSPEEEAERITNISDDLFNLPESEKEKRLKDLDDKLEKEIREHPEYSQSDKARRINSYLKAEDELRTKMYAQDFNGEYSVDKYKQRVYSTSAANKTAKEFIDKLNNKYSDYGVDFDYRITDDGRQIEYFDKNENFAYDDNIYSQIDKDIKQYFGEEAYNEPYDNVTMTVAGAYIDDRQKNYEEEYRYKELIQKGLTDEEIKQGYTSVTDALRDEHPRFTRIYEDRDDAYRGYMNGEITFEEYEEYLRKLNRR